MCPIAFCAPLLRLGIYSKLLNQRGYVNTDMCVKYIHTGESAGCVSPETFHPSVAAVPLANNHSAVVQADGQSIGRAHHVEHGESSGRFTQERVGGTGAAGVIVSRNLA